MSATEFLWPAPAAAALPGLSARLRAVGRGWQADGDAALVTRLARGLRRARILLCPGAHTVLAGSAAFAAHLAALGETDPLFFLAQRNYLARGLPPRLRLAAAVSHYGHQDRGFDPSYHAAVYHGGGLDLWQSGCGAYRITLEPGQDVMVEGGSSLVLRANGMRICVLSFSLVPRRVVDPQGRAGLPETVHFVTRKQLAADHGYQAAFHRAFDRVTPGHLCFAAFEGLVLASRRSAAVGILPAAHPVHSAGLASVLEGAYGAFWQTLGAAPLSPIGVLIPLPVVLPQVQEMTADRRRRALARRAHLKVVREAAQAALAPHLVSG